MPCKPRIFNNSRHLQEPDAAGSPLPPFALPMKTSPIDDLFAAPAALLRDLLAVSLTAVNLLRPIYGPDGTELVDFAVAYLNPVAQRITGLTERPHVTARARFPDIFTNGVFDFYRRVFETGEAGRYDFNYQADGFDNYFHVAARRSGELLVVSFTDTADQDRSAVEVALRESQARERAARAEAEALRLAAEREKLYQVFADSPAAICIQRGPAHHYEYVNAVYQQFFPDRQCLGRSVADVVPETVASGVLDLLDAVYRTGETYFGYELPLLIAQPAGHPPKQMYFTFTYQAYREAGEIVGISTVAYDVSAQVGARQRQQAHLHELFAQAPVAIAVFRGPRYVIEVANPAVCALWGRTLAQTLGTPLFELLPEAAGQGFEELLDGVMATGVPYVAHELPSFIDRNGRRDTVYWNFVYQPLHEAGDQITAVTVVATDVSEQVQARERVQHLNQELRTANQQLTRTNVDLDNFIYTASHDLKEPITNIEGLLLTLREYLPADALQVALVPRLLDLMQQDVERFQRTIHQLTSLTRLQQAHEAPAEAVDVAATVAAVRLDLAPQLAGARLTVAVAPALRVHFPPHNLRSVVYNLLSNALKYRHPDRPPVVALRAYGTAAGAVLEVQDNGLGLDTAQQGQLFGLFKRLHDHVEGTGIGLFMVRRMVENAGGTIAVRSQPGVGSTFTVTFPAEART